MYRKMFSLALIALHLFGTTASARGFLIPTAERVSLHEAKGIEQLRETVAGLDEALEHLVLRKGTDLDGRSHVWQMALIETPRSIGESPERFDDWTPAFVLEYDGDATLVSLRRQAGGDDSHFDAQWTRADGTVVSDGTGNPILAAEAEVSYQDPDAWIVLLIVAATLICLTEDVHVEWDTEYGSGHFDC